MTVGGRRWDGDGMGMGMGMGWGVKQYKQEPIPLMRGRVHTTARGQEGLHIERVQLNQELSPEIRAYYNTSNVFCFHEVMFCPEGLYFV